MLEGCTSYVENLTGSEIPNQLVNESFTLTGNQGLPSRIHAGLFALIDNMPVCFEEILGSVSKALDQSFRHWSCGDTRLSKPEPAWNGTNTPEGICEDVCAFSLSTAVETKIHIAGYAVNLAITFFPGLYI